jgi:hypothetical protein
MKEVSKEECRRGNEALEKLVTMEKERRKEGAKYKAIIKDLEVT